MVDKYQKMIKEKLRGLSGWRWAGPVVFALGFLAVFALSLQVTLGCDDFMYGTFLKGGWNYFWEKTVWHYNEFNGRAFIHFMCQVALLFDTKLYMILCPVMLAFIFIMGQRLQRKETPMWLTLLTAGMAMLAVVALPLIYIRTCVMWISAAFNYIFPPCVMLTAIWLYTRDFKGFGAWAGVLAMCFLAGATTEQTGFAACICIGGWGLLGLLRRQVPFKKFLLPLMAAGAGYATVVFAPGTWSRMEYEVHDGLLQVFQREVFIYRFRLSMRYMTGTNGIPALFVVFALLFALHLALTKRKAIWALPGLGMLAAYLLLMATHHYFFTELFSVAAFFAAAVWYLLDPRTTLRGLLLAGMLGMQLIMLLNYSAAPRTTVPAILMLLAVCASLLAECLGEMAALWPKPAKRFSWAAPGLALLVMLALLPSYLPTLSGYAKNAIVARANERELWDLSDGEVKISLDVNKYYQYQPFFASDYTLKWALKYYGISEECKCIQFSNSRGTVCNLYGTQLGLPVFMHKDKPYLPLLSAMQICGGEGHWVSTNQYSGVALILGSTEYLICTNGNVFLWDEETGEIGEQVDTTDRLYAPIYTYYAPADIVCQLFDLEMNYSPESNTYFISP